MVTDVTTDMVITKEETFGPVAPLYRFKSEDDAVKMANDTEFGLAAYFYSCDIGRIWCVAEALEYGIVGINEGIISPKSRWRDRPFGGMKESGIGPRLVFRISHMIYPLSAWGRAGERYRADRRRAMRMNWCISAQVHSVDAARRPVRAFPAKAGIHFCRGHRLSPV